MYCLATYICTFCILFYLHLNPIESVSVYFKSLIQCFKRVGMSVYYITNLKNNVSDYWKEFDADHKRDTLKKYKPQSNDYFES